MTRLDSVVDTWIELASLMSARDIETHDGPESRPSLATGMAGVGYVLGRIATARDDSTLRAVSKRWFDNARRAGVERHAGSIMFGALGITVGRALAAPSRQAITKAVETLSSSKVRKAEVMFGLAGHTFAALALPRNDSRELLDKLATRLGRCAALPQFGFAHGNAGVVAARIALAQTLGSPVDDASLAWLRGVDPARILASRQTLQRSWCNGLAGLVFAWVFATEATGDETCRDRALAAAPQLLEALDDDGGALCCGLGGRAYAMLAIARLDPEGPWVDHARALATRALQHRTHAGGVLQGLPGLVLLAHELQQPAQARFPLVESWLATG